MKYNNGPFSLLRTNRVRLFGSTLCTEEIGWHFFFHSFFVVCFIYETECGEATTHCIFGNELEWHHISTRKKDEWINEVTVRRESGKQIDNTMWYTTNMKTCTACWPSTIHYYIVTCTQTTHVGWWTLEQQINNFIFKFLPMSPMSAHSFSHETPLIVTQTQTHSMQRSEQRMTAVLLIKDNSFFSLLRLLISMYWFCAMWSSSFFLLLNTWCCRTSFPNCLRRFGCCSCIQCERLWLRSPFTILYTAHLYLCEMNVWSAHTAQQLLFYIRTPITITYTGTSTIFCQWQHSTHLFVMLQCSVTESVSIVAAVALYYYNSTQLFEKWDFRGISQRMNQPLYINNYYNYDFSASPWFASFSFYVSSIHWCC